VINAWLGMTSEHLIYQTPFWVGIDHPAVTVRGYGIAVSRTEIDNRGFPCLLIAGSSGNEQPSTIRDLRDDPRPWYRVVRLSLIRV